MYLIIYGKNHCISTSYQGKKNRDTVREMKTRKKPTPRRG